MEEFLSLNDFFNTYDSRWDYSKNKGQFDLSYDSDGNVFFIGDESGNCEELEDLDEAVELYNMFYINR